MKRTLPFALCLFIVFALVTLVGCKRGTRSNGSGDRSSPTPAAISSSAQVVKVIPSPVEISLDGSADAVITLLISPGFHINANPATFPYLIATEVTYVSEPDGMVSIGKPTYPSAINRKFAFAEKPLAVYEGDVTVKLPLRLPKSGESYGHPTKGAHLSFPFTVRVQACDEEQCYPPATINSTISVTVK